MPSAESQFIGAISPVFKIAFNMVEYDIAGQSLFAEFLSKIELDVAVEVTARLIPTAERIVCGSTFACTTYCLGP